MFFMLVTDVKKMNYFIMKQYHKEELHFLNLSWHHQGITVKLLPAIITQAIPRMQCALFYKPQILRHCLGRHKSIKYKIMVTLL